MRQRGYALDGLRSPAGAGPRGPSRPRSSTGSPGSTATIDESPGPAQRKLGEGLAEFGTYLRANAWSIPGEPVSTAFVESTVNLVVSKRTVKRQKMCWSSWGAHLFHRVRTRVLNDDLADDFHRWYPSFAHTSDRGQSLAA